ncbi:Matrix metalloproteinase-2 [Sergentomyia squamirostris]
MCCDNLSNYFFNTFILVNIVQYSTCLENSIELGVDKKYLGYSNDVEGYLMNYGYLPKSDLETGNLRTEEQFRDAIRSLQKFANLPESGVIDEQTADLLKRPRCGVSDDQDTTDFYANNRYYRRRNKRYVILGPKWDHTDLTWSLVNQSMPDLDSGQVRRVLHEALSVWARNSKLTFREMNSNKADIQVLFARGKHGDGYDFDGIGGVLAHAFYPGSHRGGDVHFDEEEKWTLDGTEEGGTSLMSVAVHEFGHSLGLGHSSVPGAIMFPWYNSYTGERPFPEDDRIAIQQIYGTVKKQWGHNPHRPPTTPSTTTTTTTTERTTHRVYYPDREEPENRPTRRPWRPYYPEHHPRPTPSTTTPQPHYPERPYHPDRPKHRPEKSDKPKTCDTSYDAISVIRGELFIFKDRYFWRIGEHGLHKGYPHEIRQIWTEIPEDFTHVDAVYENKDLQIVFFIGNKYYVFNSNRLERGYPRPLTDLGLPEYLEKIDAALIWGHNKKTYFYSGTMYWGFDEEIKRVELDYPRDMSMWKGIGYHIDAAFQWKDNRTYFFKGKGFWKFNDRRMRTEHDDPKPSAPVWMRCPRTTTAMSNDIEPPRRREPLIAYASANTHTTSAFTSILLPTTILLTITHAILC